VIIFQKRQRDRTEKDTKEKTRKNKQKKFKQKDTEEIFKFEEEKVTITESEQKTDNNKILKITISAYRS
jgi:hypothetical protein